MNVGHFRQGGQSYTFLLKRKKKQICWRCIEAVQFLSLKLQDFTALNMYLHLTNLKANFVKMMSELRHKLKGQQLLFKNVSSQSE
jgi:hypothetical protein